MLIIDKETLAGIFEHVRENYPYECCGVLTGKTGPRGQEVRFAWPVANLNKERAHDRYELDPRRFQEIDAQARRADLSVIGFYHSHPDHPPAPSEFDTQRAWEGYSYMIVAVAGGAALRAKSWVLNEAGRFEEEKIEQKG